MVPLSVKYMNLHPDVNNSRETTAGPIVDVTGKGLTQTWIMHDASHSEQCYSMVHYTFTLPVSSRKQVSIKIFILLFLLQSVQQIPG
jgi:hypothetical protein